MLRVTRDASGELQIKRLMRPGPKSTWSVQLPSVELRRAHLRFDTGSEVMNTGIDQVHWASARPRLSSSTVT